MFQEIIKEIANELNIKCTIFSKDWCILLEKDGVKRLISGYKFSLNTQASGLIADDKYALYELMRINNIPIIEHQILYAKENENDYAIGSKGLEVALDYFNNHNEDIVLKPNNGTIGNNVFHVKTKEELEDCYNKLLPSKFSISMCPYYNIKVEYRTIILDGEVKLFYAKERPILKGDGIKTIKELLIDFNSAYYSLEENLTNEALDLNYIPKRDEIVEYGWQFNLSKGSRVISNVDEEIKSKVIALAKKAYDASLLKFCSVDVIETTASEFLLLEINSGVCINKYIDLVKGGYEVAKSVYKDAILKMFE